MFFFLASAGQETKDLGDAPNVICPQCGALCHMHISVQYETLRLFFIPVFRWGKRYFAEASCCGAVFELDPSEGRSFERGEVGSIEPSLLQRLPGSPVTCHVCGSYLAPGANYCMHCGNPVR